MSSLDFQPFLARLTAFRDARDWRKFHDPKNMAMSIAVEAGELLEHFLWKSTEESNLHAELKSEEVADEMADIGKNLLLMADVLGIDLLQAMERKLAKDIAKYPADLVKGRAVKYTELRAHVE